MDPLLPKSLGRFTLATGYMTAGQVILSQFARLMTSLLTAGGEMLRCGQGGAINTARPDQTEHGSFAWLKRYCPR